jgi:glycosyltransferase involved in cell wall biosynthesis
MPLETPVIGLVGDRAGFQQAGGIRTLVQLLMQRLDTEGISHRVLTAEHPATAACSRLLIVGCSSPWAYGLALKAILHCTHLPIHWIPCFHPPRFVKHRNKARLARWALRSLQKLGVQVHVLTQAEQTELDNGSCSILSLPFDCEATSTVAEVTRKTSTRHRPYALAFLGRPVAQKGWPKYLNIVQRLSEDCLAIVPIQPAEPCPPNLNLEIGLHNSGICERLSLCQVLILPSDYESFGFAQAEALLSGCCVPVLGEWPLWLDIPELDWRFMSASQIARRVHALLGQPALLASLQAQQLQAWMHRAERAAPRLPMLHG